MNGDRLFFGGLGAGLAIGGTGIMQVFGLVLSGGIALHHIWMGGQPHD